MGCFPINNKHFSNEILSLFLHGLDSLRTFASIDIIDIVSNAPLPIPLLANTLIMHDYLPFLSLSWSFFSLCDRQDVVLPVLSSRGKKRQGCY
jgi:hypothetical protein